jgi:xanthine dehydrogenase accessory factor
MSHHLSSDLAYLRALARAPIPYVGLLGPAARREKLLGDLGSDALKLRGRLHAPVGLPLGGRTPESIALAIIAELHAFVHTRAQRSVAAAAAGVRIVALE